MVIKDKVAATVYVDATEEDLDKLDVSSLELLVFTTGLLIDTLAIRKKIPSPSLTEAGESMGGISAGARGSQRSTFFDPASGCQTRRARGRLGAPLPLAGEVGSHRRCDPGGGSLDTMTRGDTPTHSPCCASAFLPKDGGRRPPAPPPQAGEGAMRHR